MYTLWSVHTVYKQTLFSIMNYYNENKCLKTKYLVLKKYMHLQITVFFNYVRILYYNSVLIILYLLFKLKFMIE